MREERKYQRERQLKHGATVYLRKRSILPFEQLLLKMGGEVILKDLCNKTISLGKNKHVYEWVDAS